MSESRKSYQYAHRACHPRNQMLSSGMNQHRTTVPAIVSDDLKSEKQCSVAVMNANRLLGMIKRNFADRSKDTIMSLYKTLVRPHLEC